MRNYKNIFQNHLHSLHRYHIIELLKKTYFSEQHTKQNKKSKLQAGAPFGRLKTFLIYFILPKDTSERHAFLFVCYMEKYGSQIPWMGVNVL